MSTIATFIIHEVNKQATWAGELMARSLQSGSIYSAAMAAKDYFETLTWVDNELEDDPGWENAQSEKDKAFTRMHERLTQAAATYWAMTTILPPNRWIDVRSSIEDMGRERASNAPAIQFKSKEEAEMDRLADEMLMEELEISAEELTRHRKLAELDEKKRRAAAKAATARHRINIANTVVEAFVKNEAANLDPRQDLWVAEKALNRLNRLINETKAEILLRRSFSRTAQAMSNLSIFKAVYKDVELLLEKLRLDIERDAHRPEPSNHQMSKKPEDCGAGRIPTKYTNLADLQAAKSPEEELIAKEEEAETEE